MTLQDVHDYFGNWAHLARETKQGITTHRTWITQGYIPIQAQYRLEFRTQGGLKADVKHCLEQFKDDIEWGKNSAAS